MEQNFIDKNNKYKFDDNRESIEQVLASRFATYQKNKENQSYYENIFEQMNASFSQNSDLFSEMKHLSYGLAETLKKAGAQVNKLALAYQKYNLN